MNHPSDTPDECCPVCFGDGSIDVDDLPKVRAAAQALADMRTLDGAATPTSYWRTKPEGTDSGVQHNCARMVWRDPEPGFMFGCWLSAEEFAAPTPEAARAKAAASVRGNT